MSKPVWFVLPVNPEPWAVGTIAPRRNAGRISASMSPNAQLQAYQNAVRELLEDQQPRWPENRDLKVTIYLWRQMAQYKTEKSRLARAHQADATNMQKATEDAIQELLIHNDRDVQDIRTVIVQQYEDVPYTRVVIKLEAWEGMQPSEIPKPVWDAIEWKDLPDTWIYDQVAVADAETF